MEHASKRTEVAGTRRRSRRSDDTKEQVIEAAARILAKSGYESTTLEAVAAQAGVTKGTLYYHFDSKEAIYAAVLHHYLGDALGRLMETNRPDRPTIEVIEAVIDDQLEDTMRPETRYIHYQEMLRVSDGTQSMIRDSQRQYEQAFAGVLERGQRDGLVMAGDPKLLAMFVIGSIGRTARWYDPAGRVPPAAFAAMVKRFVLHGLLAPEGR